MGGGDRGAAPRERIEHQIAGVGERFHEELCQRPRKWGTVRALGRLRFDFQNVCRPRDAGMPAIFIGGVRTTCGRAAGPVPNSPLPEVDLGLSGE